MSTAEQRNVQPTRTGNRRDTQRKATKARLFDETVQEFKRTGFAETEIAVITEQVGISRGAFYVHFAGKDDVLVALLLEEEQRIVRDVRPMVERGQPLAITLDAIVSSIFKAERRLGRRLIRDLCAAQFRPEFVQARGGAEHPVLELVADAFGARLPATQAADRTTLFLTGLFGLLATAEGSQTQRRRHLDLLIELVAKDVPG